MNIPYLVGGSIHRPRVTVDTHRDGFTLHYANRTRFISSRRIANSPMPYWLVVKSLKYEAEIIACIADAADRVAHDLFDAATLRKYYESTPKEI